MDLWLIISVAIGLVALVIALTALPMLRRDRGSAGPDSLLRAGRTRDERGRVVKLLDPMPLHTLGRHDVIDESALQAIVEQLEPGTSKRRRSVIVLSLVAVAVVVVGIGAMVFIEGQSAMSDVISTLTNPAIIACIVGGSIAPWLATRQQRRRRLRAVMLNHERCPHCGSGLTGVPAGDNGRTTCPECACVWRLDDSACTDPGPVPAQNPRMLLVTLGLGLTALLAGLLAFFLML